MLKLSETIVWINKVARYFNIICVPCLFFCYHVSEQNAGGPGGSETPGWRQRRQEIRGRGDGGNLVLGDKAITVMSMKFRYYARKKYAAFYKRWASGNPKSLSHVKSKPARFQCKQMHAMK